MSKHWRWMVAGLIVGAVVMTIALAINERLTPDVVTIIRDAIGMTEVLKRLKVIEQKVDRIESRIERAVNVDPPVLRLPPLITEREEWRLEDEYQEDYEVE